MKLGDFLTTLARKSNIQIDFGTVSNVKIEELNRIELDDSIAGQLDTSLMSLDGAKNNPQVLNHFKPIILKAADDKFAILAEKYGFADELLTEKSTYKKFDILESKLEERIKELEGKQSKTSNPEKDAEYQKQINALQNQLAELTDSKKSEIEAVKQSYESQFTDEKIKTILSGKKYAHKDLPVDVNIQVARTLLNEKLKASGAVLIRENGELKLKQAANPEMDYVDSGYKPVTFSDFTDKTLAEHKLLDVSNGTPPATSQQHQQQHQMIPGQSNLNRGKFDAALQASLNDLKEE